MTMCMCVCEIESRLSNANVALGRPAWQSTIYCDEFGCHPANFGNDGQITKTSHMQLSCAATRDAPPYDVNPWWAVDLGSPLYVDGVNLTSRRDCCGQ